MYCNIYFYFIFLLLTRSEGALGQSDCAALKYQKSIAENKFEIVSAVLELLT